ncbi:hypothetical protein MKEN_00462800 [Mycena kentingensis (nom. inval.)]|nr:hypothetical protein MKEN_00462800 [Mycena kentingensis (nom. inval.)]
MRGLPLDNEPPQLSHRLVRALLLPLLLATAFTAAFFVHTHDGTNGVYHSAQRDFFRVQSQCPAQPAPLSPPLAFSPSNTSVFIEPRPRHLTERRRTGAMSGCARGRARGRIRWTSGCMLGAICVR